MSTLALLLLTIPQLATTQDTSITPTTLHFFPRTSCNRGTSLSYTTVADLYADTTCHTTPVGTEALYVDGVAGGCAVQAFSDSACSPSALLSQESIPAGVCQYYGDGNSIGAWMGVCGAGADAGGSANSSMSSSTSASFVSNADIAATTSTVSFSTMSRPANGTVTSTGMGGGNATASYRATATAKPGLQGPDGVAKSRGVGLREEDWGRRMVMRGLLLIGSAEVVWGWGF